MHRSLLLFLLFAATVRAQDSISTKTAEEVVVEAQKPFSAASDAEFRNRDFQLRPRNSAQDILRVVPGLFIAQHAGGGKAEQIFLRGFDCDHGTDINISVDDAPVNMVSHGHGQGYADLHFVIPELVERVEVAKGPYFARYGDLATAGTVVFKTKDTIENNTLTLEGGAFGTYRGLGLIKAPFASEKTTGLFGGEFFASRGYFDAPQDFRRANLFVKVTSATADDAKLSASVMSFSAGWNASGQIPERAVASGMIGRFGAIDTREGGSTSRTTAIIRYEGEGKDPFKFTGSFTDYRFRLFSNFTFFAADPVKGDMIEQTDSRTILALRAESEQASVVGDVIMKTRFGGSLRSDDIEVGLYRDSARTRIGTTAEGTIVERQFGSFVEHDVNYDIAHVQLGLRADYLTFDVVNRLRQGAAPEGVRQQFALSPKVNLSIVPSDAIAFFGNFGMGFHSNDARVVVASEDNAQTLARAIGSEAGVRLGKPNSVVSGSIALWMLDLESELVYIGDEGTFEPSGRTRRQGIDIEAHIQPFDWLTLGADMTISKGRFRDLPEGENSIPLAPNMTLTANAMARWEDASSALRVRMIDDRPANETNSVIAKGYAVVDLSGSYKILSNVEVFAGIENLFNTEWNEAQFDTESRLQNEPEPVSELHFTPGTPRSIRAGIQYSF